jgi:hypothetical protein
MARDWFNPVPGRAVSRPLLRSYLPFVTSQPALIALFGLLVVLLPAQGQNLIPGRSHGFMWTAGSPGLCVVSVESGVALFRVESKTPGFSAVIWEGLPRTGDYIDTLGANDVTVQAFFAAGTRRLAGDGVVVRRASFGMESKETRPVSTVRSGKRAWDFSLWGKNYCPGGQPASATGYKVRPGSDSPAAGRQAKDASLPFDQCRAVAGRWKWFTGGTAELDERGGIVSFNARGEREPGGDAWICRQTNPVTIEIQWSRGGWRDILRLVVGGNRLEGENQIRAKVSAERIAAEAPPEKCGAAGRWRWFNGAVFVIDAKGGAVGYDAKGTKLLDQGTYRCVDPVTRTVEIRWKKGWVDTLSLNLSGNRLEGTNQYRTKIWAELIK